MRTLLKLLAILCILLGGIYAATPLWFPQVLTRQLPPAWHLEELQLDYPGITGVDFSVLRLRGEVAGFDVLLTANDVRAGYARLETGIGTLLLEVKPHATAGPGGADFDVQGAIQGQSVARGFSLDGLSLPVMALPQNVPALAVEQLRLELYGGPAGPLQLDFQPFHLNPTPDGGYRVSTQFSAAAYPGVTVRAEAEVATGLLSADLRIPAGADLPAWLELRLEQDRGASVVTTQINAGLDFAAIDPQWLAVILGQVSGGGLTGASGKLVAQAEFSGQDRQELEQLSFSSDDLAIIYEGGVPGFEYPGGIDHDIRAQFSGFEARVGARLEDIPSQSAIATTATARGMVVLDWREGSPFTYTSPDSSLQADGLSLATTGQFRLHDQILEYEQTGDFRLRLDNLRSGLRTEQVWSRFDSGHLEASGRLDFSGSIVDPGAPMTFAFSGPMKGAGVKATLPGDDGSPPLTVTADALELDWRGLVLPDLTGEVQTRTRGFAAGIEDQNWSGFDFDIKLDLAGATQVDGLGAVGFDAGPSLPFELHGDPQARRWIIALPPIRFPVAQLGGLLSAGRMELPETVKLTDGDIDLQGQITVDGEIGARLTVAGQGIGVSVLKSRARGGGFAFDTVYDGNMSASGWVSFEQLALAGGVDLLNIHSQLEFGAVDGIAIGPLEAHLLEGRLRLASARILNNGLEDTTVELTGIDLGRLLAFADIDGLEGTGTLDFSLPIGADDSGVYIQNGTFNAVSPGRLAYNWKGMTATNIGLQALENFQYKGLSGTLNYLPSGAYEITVRLEGGNPDLYEGHPIVFTLNINGSLPDLFDALFITGDFEEAILNQIRRN